MRRAMPSWLMLLVLRLMLSLPWGGEEEEESQEEEVSRRTAAAAPGGLRRETAAASICFFFVFFPDSWLVIRGDNVPRPTSTHKH